MLSVGHRHLDGGLAHGDADDVRLAAQGTPRPRLPLQPQPNDSFRWIISTYAAALDVVLTIPRHAADWCLLTHGRERLPLRQGSERILPAAGHRPAERQRRRRAAHLLSGAGREGEVVRGAGPDRSRMSRPSPWWPGPAAADSAATRRNINVQLKPAGRPQVDLGPGARPPAPQDLRHARRDDVPAELAGRAHRRPPGQRAISIHAAGPGLRVAGAVGTEGSGSALAAAGDRRRQLRPAELGLVVERDHRSRHRVAPRPHGAGGRRGALRRLRPAPGLGDVQVDQSVSRGAGAAAAMVGEPGLPENDLRPDAAGHRRAAVDLHPLHPGDHAHLG